MTDRLVRVAIFGASGRMGRALVGIVSEAAGCDLAGATGSPGNPQLGQDVGTLAGFRALGVPLTGNPAEALATADVAIDVALPAAGPGNLHACVEAGVPVVIGSTGHDSAGHEAIEQAATRIAVLVAPNMSVGVNVLLVLADQAARALDANYDAEIFEAHHRHKRDAPSGTALALGDAIARGRGTPLESVAVYARHGSTGERPSGSIGFSVLRGGDIVGEHVVTFAGPGERIELAHRASDRATFARGGLSAARWLVGRAPGRYSMRDVLGL